MDNGYLDLYYGVERKMLKEMCFSKISCITLILICRDICKDVYFTQCGCVRSTLTHLTLGCFTIIALDTIRLCSSFSISWLPFYYWAYFISESLLHMFLSTLVLQFHKMSHFIFFNMFNFCGSLPRFQKPYIFLLWIFNPIFDPFVFVSFVMFSISYPKCTLTASIYWQNSDN